MFMFDLKGRETAPQHRPSSKWYHNLLSVVPGLSTRPTVPLSDLDQETTFASPMTLARIGPLEVRVAMSASEVRKAQELRYKVFYEEMSAKADARTRRTKRDADEYDPLCDHIIVLDHDSAQGVTGRPKIVGTYRALRSEVALAANGFYSAAEFDLKPMLATHWQQGFCEVGRSCVLPEYRDKRTMEALWVGLWAYAVLNNIDVYFGVASFEGTNPDEHKEALSFLHHHCPAPEEWRVSPQPDVAGKVDYMAADEINERAIMKKLPPLIKGYLRIGAYVGDGIFIDKQFGTTDVMIITLLDQMPERYKQHFRTLTGLDRKN